MKLINNERQQIHKYLTHWYAHKSWKPVIVQQLHDQGYTTAQMWELIA